MNEFQPTRQDVDGAAPHGPIRDARHSPRAWTILLIVLLLGLAADLYTKAWSFANVHREPVVLERDVLVADPAFDPTLHTNRVNLLPGDVLGLRLALNRGAVFGVGANHRWFFIAFTMAAAFAGLYVFGTRIRAHETIAHVGMGFALAGALGNFYDRVTFAAVRDFIQFMPDRRLPDGWTWPGGNPELLPWVFNIADVLLLVGVVTMMVYVGRRRKRRKAAATSSAETLVQSG